MKVNKRKLNRFWGAFEEVPLIEVLEERLPSLGFKEQVKIDYGSGILEWVQDVGNTELSLLLNPVNCTSGIEFWVQIGIGSKEVKKIMDMVKPWECDPFSASVYVDRNFDSERLANIRLCTLLKSLGVQDSLSTYSCDSNSYKLELNKLISHLQIAFKAGPIVSLCQPDELVMKLKYLAESDLGKLSDGFGSADPMVYSALLKKIGGDLSLSLELLEQAKYLELAENEKLWGGDKKELEEINQITKCRFKKLANGIASNKSDNRH